MKLQRTKQNSKNGKNSFVGSGVLSQAKPPFIASPPLLANRRVARADFPCGEGKCASWRHRGNWPWKLAIWRGEGGVICGLILFDNGSSDWAQIQHEDGQCHSLPFLFYKICLTLTGNL